MKAIIKKSKRSLNSKAGSGGSRNLISLDGVSENSDTDLYTVELSLRFIVTSLLCTTALAFVVGCGCRLFWTTWNFQKHSNPEETARDFFAESASNSESHKAQLPYPLPSPILAPGKRLPHFVYSSKSFEDGSSTTSDSLLVREVNHSTEVVDGIHAGVQEDNEIHAPKGQHLLVDIENVDSTFLSSEVRLAEGLVELVARSGLTLLSYHCHQLKAEGVGCIGVLLESHVSLHTWPRSGVISLDLFTCGPKPLLQTLPYIEDLFAIPRRPSEAGGVVEPPHVEWAHKLRGFELEEAKKSNRQDLRMHQRMLGWMEYDLKDQIASKDTGSHHVDIYDVLNPRFRRLESYKRSLQVDGKSYESQHPELFLPDRIVFLESSVQSSRYGGASYHEALVHPTMFTHDGPRRVVIIGGEEGATLREVLKHKTVEKVVEVEVDDELVELSKKFLPEWSDCSGLVGSTASCFADPRVEMLNSSAAGWFQDNFGGRNESSTAKYDVIIVDSLNPSLSADFFGPEKDALAFAQILYDALSPGGMVVTQSKQLEHERSHRPAYKDGEEYLAKSLKKAGFQWTEEYEDALNGLTGRRTFLVAFKDAETKSNWYADQAKFDLQVQKRSAQTNGDAPLFRHFDSASMMNYQRVLEVSLREGPNKPQMCSIGLNIDPTAHPERKLNQTNTTGIEKFLIRALTYDDNAEADSSPRTDIFTNQSKSVEAAGKKLSVSDHITDAFCELFAGLEQCRPRTTHPSPLTVVETTVRMELVDTA